MSAIACNVSVTPGPAYALMRELQPVLESTISQSGMPKTLQEQNAFIANHGPELQNWTFTHLGRLQEAGNALLVPSDRRYGRNLVLHVPVGEKSSICVFLHRLNTETPKHWHSDKEKKISALAFAAILNNNVFETRWPVEIEGRKFVQLKEPSIEEAPVGALAAIPGDYGVHQISNRSKEGGATLFEIYYEDEDLNSLDIPVSVLDSSEEHFVDTIPCSWLPDLNLEETARKESWPQVSESVLMKKESPKIFMVVQGETNFVPLERAKLLISSGDYSIYEGPGERFLLALKETAPSESPSEEKSV